MKTRMKKLLAGMCAVLILPIGSAQTVLAEEPEQNFDIRRKSGKSDIKTMVRFSCQN